MPLNQRRCRTGYSVGGDPFVRSDDEGKFLFFYRAYRPGPVSHSASSRWATECFCIIYRFFLLVGTTCYLFGSIRATSLRKCEGIVLWTNCGLLLSSLIAISWRYASSLAGDGFIPRVYGYRAHIPCDQKAKHPMGGGILALLIVMGYAIVPLVSTNREIRFEFPAIVALPFLTGVLLSGTEHSAPGRYAALAAGLVFCGLLAAGLPTWHRANRQSISRCDAVLAQAAKCNAKLIMLATG